MRLALQNVTRTYSKEVEKGFEKYYFKCFHFSQKQFSCNVLCGTGSGCVFNVNYSSSLAKIRFLVAIVTSVVAAQRFTERKMIHSTLKILLPCNQISTFCIAVSSV